MRSSNRDCDAGILRDEAGANDSLVIEMTTSTGCGDDQTMQSHELVSILQTSVSPVILISGVGLLILSMTNRLGRAVDRTRQLRDELNGAPNEERSGLQSQLTILYRRARLLRSAISFGTFSVLMAAILVIVLFITAFLHVELVLFCAIIFMTCLVSLITSLLLFLKDINLSLAALRLELGTNVPEAE